MTGRLANSKFYFATHRKDFLKLSPKYSYTFTWFGEKILSKQLLFYLIFGEGKFVYLIRRFFSYAKNRGYIISFYFPVSKEMFPTVLQTVG